MVTDNKPSFSSGGVIYNFRGDAIGSGYVSGADYTPNSQKSSGGSSSSSGGSSSSSSGSSKPIITTPTASLTPTPIYNTFGQLVGINDPQKQQSRLPTPAEKLLYGFKTSGGGSGGSKQTITTLATTLAPTPKYDSSGKLVGINNPTKEILKLVPFKIQEYKQKINEFTQKKANEKAYKDEQLYTNLFNNATKNLQTTYDDKGNPVAFEVNGRKFDGQYAYENLNNYLNWETNRQFIKTKQEERKAEIGEKAYEREQVFNFLSEKIEGSRQKAFATSDKVMNFVNNFKLPSGNELYKIGRKIDIKESEIDRLKENAIKNQKVSIEAKDFWKNAQVLLNDKTNKDKFKREFVKGSVDSVFDVLNVANLVGYSVNADNKTRKAIGASVLLALIQAPDTYIKYLKKDPVAGVGFTLGSLVGIDDVIKLVSKGARGISKIGIEKKITRTISEINAIKDFNIKKLKDMGFNNVQLQSKFGLDYARVVNGLDDASSIGIQATLKKATPAQIKLWSAFEGAGESTGKISNKVLKEFGEKELGKGNIMLDAFAETKISTDFTRELGKKISDLSNKALPDVTKTTKGVTVTVKQVPTGRIIGTRTGKNFFDEFVVSADKSFSGVAKKIMKNGDIVEQKYATRGLNTVVKEFYVNGKLRYTVNVARDSGNAFVKSGDDIISKNSKKLINKKMELTEGFYNRVNKEAIIMDIKQNFYGNIKAYSETVGVIKISPLKKTFEQVEVLLKSGKRWKRIDVLTSAQIVKTKGRAFADFIKKRNTPLLAGDYVKEISKMKSMVLPEFLALQRNLNSATIKGVYKRSPTLFERIKTSYLNFEKTMTTFPSRMYSLTGFAPVGKKSLLPADLLKKYGKDLSLARNVRVNFGKKMQIDLNKMIVETSNAIKTFQKLNVNFNIQKLWASRLVRLKIQNEYLKYLNKQKILSQGEYTKLASLSSQAQLQKTAQKTLYQQKYKQKQYIKTDYKKEFKQDSDFKFKTNLQRIKLEVIRIPDLTHKARKSFVNSVLGMKKSKSYMVLIGSGKKMKRVGGKLKPEEAISYGAYLTDRGQQRTVRIVPAKGNPTQRFKIDYLAQARKKFRNYRIKKGKRVAYSSARLIEKRKYFNDKPNEVRRRKK